MLKYSLDNQLGVIILNLFQYLLFQMQVTPTYLFSYLRLESNLFIMIFSLSFILFKLFSFDWFLKSNTLSENRAKHFLFQLKHIWCVILLGYSWLEKRIITHGNFCLRNQTVVQSCWLKRFIFFIQVTRDYFVLRSITELNLSFSFRNIDFLQLLNDLLLLINLWLLFGFFRLS